MSETLIHAPAVELAARTASFVRDTVIPVEREVIVDRRPVTDELRLELNAAARAAGVFGPLSPVEYGGLGLDFRGQAHVLGAAGESLIGPLALHCWSIRVFPARWALARMRLASRIESFPMIRGWWVVPPCFGGP